MYVHVGHSWITLLRNYHWVLNIPNPIASADMESPPARCGSQVILGHVLQILWDDQLLCCVPRKQCVSTSRDWLDNASKKRTRSFWFLHMACRRKLDVLEPRGTKFSFRYHKIQNIRPAAIRRAHNRLDIQVASTEPTFRVLVSSHS